MSQNSVKNQEASSKIRSRRIGLGLVLVSCFCILTSACGLRADMQDQPRYKTYKKSDFFADGRASRRLPDGTVARGQLYDNKAFYTGKIDNPSTTPVETTTNAAGNTLVTSFPNAIDEFPIPVTKELVDRGQERYGIYCAMCHGPLGNADGMIVRRGFSPPPTYHDDRLRNAPVGHFFDVITNGWGKMSSYAYQIQPADRWAIVAYIRTLQAGQNPDNSLKMNTAAAPKPEAPKTATPGGAK